VSALFYGDSKVAADQCKKELMGATLPVVELSKNNYLMQGDYTMTVNCGQARPRITKVKAGEEVKVKPDCLWTGPEFILVGSEEDGGHTVKTDHVLTAEVAASNDLVEGLQQVLGNNNISFQEWTMDALLPEATYREEQQLWEDDEEDAAEEEDEGPDWFFIGGLITIGISSTLLLSIIFIAIYRRCRKPPAIPVAEVGTPGAHLPSPQHVGGGHPPSPAAPRPSPASPRAAPAAPRPNGAGPGSRAAQPNPARFGLSTAPQPGCPRPRRSSPPGTPGCARGRREGDRAEEPREDGGYPKWGAPLDVGDGEESKEIYAEAADGAPATDNYALIVA